MSSIPAQTSANNEAPINYFRYIPLLTPAVDRTTFRVDESALEVRGQILRITALVASCFELANPLVLLTSLVVTLFADDQRSRNAVSRNLIQAYLDNPTPSFQVVNCLANNIRAINNLIKTKNLTNSQLDKKDASGKTLIENTEDLEIFKKLIDREVAITPELVVSLSQKQAWFTYLLEKINLNPDDFTAEQQAEFWNSPEVAKLLNEKGFDVDVRDAKGQTHLFRAVKNDMRHGTNSAVQIVNLLKSGADPRFIISLSDRSFTSPWHSAQFDPRISQLFKQHAAQPQGQTSAPPTNTWKNKFNWIPFVKPALQENGCEIDTSVQSSRMLGVVLAVVSVVFFSTWEPLIIVVTALTLLLLPFIDSWRNEKLATENSIKEYINQPFPSVAATRRIAVDPKAIDTLVREGHSLNKLNEEGVNLLSLACLGNNFDTFKLLFDEDVDMTLYFQSATEHADPQYLAYICEERDVFPDYFDNQTQVEIWSRIGSAEAADELAKEEFDVNIVGRNGMTPLIGALLEGKRPDNKISQYDLVVKLLELGANKNVTYEDKTLAELTEDADLKALLQA